MATLSPVNPSKYIHSHVPAVEPAKNIASWFKNETLELNFGEYVGRPNKNILLHKEYLTRFLENGWTVDAVLETAEGGNWMQVTRETESGSNFSTRNQTGSSQSSSSESTAGSSVSTSTTNGNESRTGQTVTNRNSHVTSEQTNHEQSTEDYGSQNNSTNTTNSGSVTTNYTNSNSGSSSSGGDDYSRSTSTSSSSSSNTTQSQSIQTQESTSTNSRNLSTQTDASSESDTDESTTTNTNERSSSSSTGNENNSTSGNKSESSSTTESTNGNESSATQSSSTSEAEGDAYWFAYQRIRLKRRRMQPELVLQTMVTSFTNEYNSGRSIDNARYEELLSLYSVMVSHTENEANAIISNAMDITPLFDKVVYSVNISLESAQNRAVAMGTDIEQASLADINRQFDALKSEQMANMISNGMFNNTVWASVDAGIERQRGAALAKARAESSQIVVNSYTSIAQVKGSVWSSLLAARQSMSDALDKRRITATEVRNTVLKWMLDYAGSREEVYPTLEEVSAIAQQLGFSVGAAGNVL